MYSASLVIQTTTSVQISEVVQVSEIRQKIHNFNHKHCSYYDGVSLKKFSHRAVETQSSLNIGLHGKKHGFLTLLPKPKIQHFI